MQRGTSRTLQTAAERYLRRGRVYGDLSRQSAGVTAALVHHPHLRHLPGRGRRNETAGNEGKTLRDCHHATDGGYCSTKYTRRGWASYEGNRSYSIICTYVRLAVRRYASTGKFEAPRQARPTNA